MGKTMGGRCTFVFGTHLECGKNRVLWTWKRNFRREKLRVNFWGNWSLSRVLEKGGMLIDRESQDQHL